MGDLVAWFNQTFPDPSPQLRALHTLIAVVAIWAARRLLLTVLLRRVDDPSARYRLRKTTTYIAVPIGIFAVGVIWSEGFQSFATFLGLASAGVAIALKDLIVNLAGWGFLLWRRPFEVGDRIQIGDHAGDVIDIRIFMFTLMEIGNWVDAEQSTGRVIHIPNGRVLNDFVANYSKGFQYIWNEIPILVTFESNWQRAKQILLEIAERHGVQNHDDARRAVDQAAEKFLISYSKLTPTVYTTIADSGVLLTIRHLAMPRQRRGLTQTISEDILAAFSECDDIDFAYPTQRLYYNQLEGKVDARAPGVAPFGERAPR